MGDLHGNAFADHAIGNPFSNLDAIVDNGATVVLCGSLSSDDLEAGGFGSWVPITP